MNELMIAETEIRQDGAGRYCLNDLHRAAGGENRHRPSLWVENQQTQSLIEEIAKAGIPALASIKGGAAPGTYVVKELVYAYAMWISPAFSLRVIRAFDALVTGDLARAQAMAAPPMPTSVSHRADHVVSATRCFNGLMRAATSLNLGRARAAQAANLSALKHTGIDILDELGVDPDELPHDFPRSNSARPNPVDDLAEQISAWLDDPARVNQPQFTGEEICLGLFSIGAEDRDYRSLLTRIGTAMARLGWRKRRSNGPGRPHFYQRP